MGAGASVDDTDDLKKEYEKVKGNLTEEQQKKLEGTFNDEKNQKKGEFYVIGKCRKEYGELAGDQDPAFAKKAAPAPAPAPAAEPAQPPAPEGVERFKLTDLKKVVAAAFAEGKTPLLLDQTNEHQIDTFFSYQGDFSVIDVKAMALAHTTGDKKPVADCLEDVRQKLVYSMKPPGNGRIAVLAMQQAAVDFVGKFNGDDTLPLALFDNGAKAFIGVDNALSKPMFRDADTVEQAGMSSCGEEFGVVVSSYFSSEDIDDFLFKGDYGLPDKSKFKILELELS